MAGDRPWWLMTTSARHGFLTSLLALGPASAFLVAGFLVKTPMLLGAAVWLAIALFYLLSALAVRRLERSGAAPPAEQQSQPDQGCVLGTWWAILGLGSVLDDIGRRGDS